MQTTRLTGSVIANRFEVGQVAGSGGMGTVYRAQDRATGELVALKILHQVGSGALEARRFAREARILSELRHPGIASYVDSGQTSEGVNYLAMEWLEGEDLAQRKNRGALSVHEALQLLQRVAEALSYAHQVGIVHRDIKPSNLFLRNKQFDRLVLLDFGVAHYEEQQLTQSVLTRAGAIIGTLEYMAPEQVRAEQAINAAADIYSLGRIVYRGLWGQKPRASEHVAAVLARTLFEDEPPLAQICPGIPLPLSDLLSRMLAKDAARRPPNGTALLAELALLGQFSDLARGSTSLPSDSELKRSEEQNLYTIVLAVPGATSLSGIEKTEEALRQQTAARQALEATLINHQASPRWLLDGSLLLTMALCDSAHDQALRAARCALMIKERWPSAAVGLATGRGQLSRQEIIGEVVDRAAHLLGERRAVALQDPKVAAAEPGSVWVDELSASLLERRFVLVSVTGGALLTREAISSDDARPVLGILPPCLGREQELTILEALLNRCRDDSEPQVVLITAPPGLGKTRLRQEFLNRLRRRSWPKVTMLGVGELLSAGAPYAIIGQVLRGVCDIAKSDTPRVSWQRLTACCTELLGAKHGLQAAGVLGEMCGLAVLGEDPPDLRAVRGDPSALSAHRLEAFTALLGAFCDRAPVVLVLDDLHWGDAATIHLLDGALRAMEGRPFMLLALARPVVKTEFPRVQKWPRLKEISLDGLSRGASERLVRFILAGNVGPETVMRLSQQAAGNALLLEELIRADHERKGEALPETVLAILQARMHHLEPGARMVLGAASVFSERFLRVGLQSLLDVSVTSIAFNLEEELRLLVQEEFFAMSRPSQVGDEAECGFRHPLMREAAYGLLAEEPKKRWHRAAGEYLERLGDADALVLAQHFDRGDQPVRAVPYFARAAAQALDGNDLMLVRSCVARALANQPTDPNIRGELLGLLSAALNRGADSEGSFRAGQEALPFLRPGSVRWCRTLHALLVTSLMLRRQEMHHDLTARFLATKPQPEAAAAYMETGAVLLNVASLRGDRTTCRHFLARMEELAAEKVENEPSVMVCLRHGQQRISRMLGGDPWTAWCHAAAAAEAALHSRNQRWIGYMQGEQALAELDLGSVLFEAKLRTAMEILSSIEEDKLHGYFSVSLALWLAGNRMTASEAEQTALAMLAQHKDTALVSGIAHCTLSHTAAARGSLADAEHAARQALVSFAAMPAMRLGVFAELTHVLLSQGRVEEANATAQEGMAQLDGLEGVGWKDLSLRLAHIEALRAAGDFDRASSELRSALSILAARAARIPDPAWRQRYLENIAENAHLLALAQEKSLPRQSDSDAVPRST